MDEMDAEENVVSFWGDELNHFKIIHQRILDSFMCPVCFRYVHPPIPQCIYGHICCQTCDQQMDMCPTCLGFKSNWTSFFLNNLFQIVTFPCNYYDEGCRFKAKGSLLVEHTSTCEYADVECIIDGCSWEDRFIDLPRHLQTVHCVDHKIIPEGSITVDVDRTVDRNSPETYSMISIEALGCNFIIVVKRRTGFYSWLFFMLDRRRNDNYRVKLRIGSVLDEYHLRSFTKKFSLRAYRSGFIRDQMLNEWCDGEFRQFEVIFCRRRSRRV